MPLSDDVQDCEPVGEHCPPALPGDLADTIATDVEALFLCALLWAPNPLARTVVGVLTPADFHSVVYGDLFAVVADLVAAGTPHAAPMVLAELQRRGELHGHRGDQLTAALTAVTLPGASAEAVTSYADAVLAQAYRRSYRAAAVALAQAAEELPEADLFEHLVQIGTAQRARWRTLTAFRGAAQ